MNGNLETFSRAPEAVVESEQQSASLPLLNHNNRKRDSNVSKWNDDDFTDLLGCVALFS